MKNKLRFENFLLILVILIGVSFSIFQYIYNRSLWLDESYLSLNIINRNFKELLQPLSYQQVAPILFLYIEKLATVLLGLSEYALRLFPLLSYLASIYFLYKILKILELNIYTILLSLSLFIFNGSIIYYSSEVKQYMIDVLVITCMVYFTLKKQKSSFKRYVLLGLLGSISIFLTNVSPIILLICGTYMFYEDVQRGWKELKGIIIVGFIWIVIFGIYYIFFIYKHPTQEFMVLYWSSWAGGSFLPTNPFRIDFYQFIIYKYNVFYNQLFQFGKIGSYVLQLLFLLGCYCIFEKKKYKLFILGIFPIFIHLVLSALKLYPFDTRLLLYTAPVFIIILSYGFEFVLSYIKTKKQTIFQIFSLLLTLLLIFTTYSKLPVKTDEPREGFLYINQEIEKDDIIFASHYSKFPLMYYMESSQVDFSSNEVILEPYINLESFGEGIAKLKGRVWFVFKDFLEFRKINYLKEKFDDENHKLLDEFHAQDVTVLLYEII